MFVAETYLKEGDEFVPIARATESIRDPEYVDGALVLRAGSKVLLGTDEWTDVNWLWVYLLDVVEGAISRQSRSTYFPDQPIQLSVEPVPRGRGREEFVKVHVSARGLERQAKVPRDEFIVAMRQCALEFFERIVDLCPRKRATFEPHRKRVDGWAP